MGGADVEYARPSHPLSAARLVAHAEGRVNRAQPSCGHLAGSFSTGAQHLQHVAGVGRQLCAPSAQRRELGIHRLGDAGLEEASSAVANLCRERLRSRSRTHRPDQQQVRDGGASPRLIRDLPL